MASTFDPALTESTHLINAHLVHIYKVGGGTIGRRYQGKWAYRINQNGKVVASGTDLHTGMPKTHDEVAVLALELSLEPAGGGR